MKILKKIFSKSARGKAVNPDLVEEVAELAGRRAENYFQEHRLNCAEAALLVINTGFGGDLTAEQALRLGSGFGGGVGGSGCVCGALSGGVMGLGLFLGPACPDGLGKKQFRKVVAGYHDSFREESGSVCCRDLIADFRKDRKGKAAFCRGLTGRSAGEAVRLILRYRPELAGRVDFQFLRDHQSTTAVILGKLISSQEHSGN